MSASALALNLQPLGYQQCIPMSTLAPIPSQPPFKRLKGYESDVWYPR